MVFHRIISMHKTGDSIPLECDTMQTGKHLPVFQRNFPHLQVSLNGIISQKIWVFINKALGTEAPCTSNYYGPKISCQILIQRLGWMEGTQRGFVPFRQAYPWIRICHCQNECFPRTKRCYQSVCHKILPSQKHLSMIWIH